MLQLLFSGQLSIEPCPLLLFFVRFVLVVVFLCCCCCCTAAAAFVVFTNSHAYTAGHTRVSLWVCFILHSSIVLYYSIALCEVLRTYVDLRHTNTILTDWLKRRTWIKYFAFQSILAPDCLLCQFTSGPQTLQFQKLQLKAIPIDKGMLLNWSFH